MHRISLAFLVLTIVLHHQAQVPAVKSGASFELDVTQCWTHPYEGGHAEIVANDTRIFVISEPAVVTALSFDGGSLWSADLGGEVRSNVLPLATGVLLVTSAAGSEAGLLRSLSKETGITGWSLRLPPAERHILVSANGYTVVISGATIRSIDPRTGTVGWMRESTIGPIKSAVFAERNLLLAGEGSKIANLTPATGDIQPLLTTRAGVTAIAANGPNEIYIGDERGSVTLFEPPGSKPAWRFRTGGRITSLAVLGDHLLATSHDNFVYWLSRRNGGVDWKRRLTGRVAHLVQVTPRHLLITSNEDPSPFIVDLETGRGAGRLAFDGGGANGSPVFAGGSIVIPATTGIYGYRLDGCTEKSDGGRGTGAGAAKNN